MKGTEKQIAWANEIRAKIMSALDNMANTARKDQYTAFCAWIDSKDSAAWWIDNWEVTRTANMFLRKVMREYKA